MTLQGKAAHVTGGGSRHAFRRAGEHTVIQRLRRNSDDPVFNGHGGRDFSEKRFRVGHRHLAGRGRKGGLQCRRILEPQSGNLDFPALREKFPNRVAYFLVPERKKSNACEALRVSAGRGLEPWNT